MLEIDKFDLDETATALADQSAYDEHRYLIEPADRRGRISGPATVASTARRPLTSMTWISSRSTRCARVSGSRTWRMSPRLVGDEQAARRLARAIDGRGAFRRFNNELHQEYSHLIPAWRAFRDNRAACWAG
ncbi:UPF0158 family protein [Phytohabitans flavus]|uniref:Uncharacterized protein n=1 Tax=Phytohabitans flavus TaxID=1076124 RepID=A0A6F8XZB5_9ACTN|nr:hypothetical protein [Phytohabitans flavus]BCB79165.1 hypothetical protein Pflav_055750 [Phytohabitans flavus]